ncbi:MAG: 1-deoxy-D-xylulose-5-phosphate synthase [Gammaproteobacteria bacterium]|nr:1-deoxy-D-xylulose-5-phosphate synthase [Gammaproteobacteria bacterium]
MSDSGRYPLLQGIDDPSDLRALPEAALPRLARELRSFLVESVSRSGGHFSAGLGSIELTIALHYLYNTPEDRIVWDVGHQAYPHKILTGRRDRIETVRQWGGLAPFPKRDESPYDSFGVGHSSTSISAALGMALAARASGSERRAIAVIGDGGLTAGMAFEALNHAGDLGADLLVILNDNNMAISPNVGALANRFAQLLSGTLYKAVREGGKRVLANVPPVLQLASRVEEHVKGMIMPGTLFEEFGFNYIGPIDGHDLPALLTTLRNLRTMRGPQFLHVITRKGKGYDPAEADPVAYHGVAPFDPTVGIAPARTPSKATFSDVFGDWACDLAALDRRLVAITPAMREGSGLVRFAREFPDRYFDVGIAEQHAVTVAAGMACDGLKPVVAIYSTFLQRGYDQVIHDVVTQRLPVLFAIDRAGLVGSDGPTHNGSFDLTYLRCLPEVVVMTPADENECRQMLYTGFLLDRPAFVRYPRGSGTGIEVQRTMQALPLGAAQLRRRGTRAALLVFGTPLPWCLQVGDELDATVVNMRFVKPLDERLLLEVAAQHELLVTVEENAITGGAGSAVNELLAANGIAMPILNYGLPDRFVAHGTQADMLRDAGMTPAALRAAIEARLAASAASAVSEATTLGSVRAAGADRPR